MSLKFKMRPSTQQPSILTLASTSEQLLWCQHVVVVVAVAVAVAVVVVVVVNGCKGQCCCCC